MVKISRGFRSAARKPLDYGFLNSVVYFNIIIYSFDFILLE